MLKALVVKDEEDIKQVMDGLDPIMRLKENPEPSGIPVVMVTVMNARATAAMARELGVIPVEAGADPVLAVGMQSNDLRLDLRRGRVVHSVTGLSAEHHRVVAQADVLGNHLVSPILGEEKIGRRIGLRRQWVD
jgi:CheY-like chemotaxis protein